MELPDEALHGIHSIRASMNFPSQEPFQFEWYKSSGKVKIACYETVIRFRQALEKEHPDLLHELRIPSLEILNALIASATEVSGGEHFLHFIVPAIQGGAGTSINMNINEIIANRALQLLGEKPGSYSIIDPIETANIYQSTNDVIPTALKIAVMELLNSLEAAVNETRQFTETLEKKYRSTLRVSYTQLQEAVPGTYGQLFGSYSEALSRDWWRISKAFERIKQVNLGGGAIGTGISIPRFFIMEVVGQLRKVTGLPLAQGENLTDITANQDSLVEVHAILKAHAVNLEKMVSDLRLLSSGLSGEKEVHIPERQAGSSIMPGKVNPVIPEYVVSAAHQVYSNDQLITTLAAQGNFELNAYLPSIGHALIGSLKLLISMNTAVSDHLLAGLEIDSTAATSRLFHSPAVTTALSPLIGYHRAAELSGYMKKQKADIFTANDALKIMAGEKLKRILTAEYLIKKGFQVKDIIDFNRGAQ